MTVKDKKQWSKELCSACWKRQLLENTGYFPFSWEGIGPWKKIRSCNRVKYKSEIILGTIQNEVLESPSYHFNKTISKYCTVKIPCTYTALFPSRTCTFTKTSAHFTIREFETGRKRTSEWLDTMPGKNLSSESWPSTVSSKL